MDVQAAAATHAFYNQFTKTLSFCSKLLDNTEKAWGRDLILCDAVFYACLHSTQRS